MKTVTKTLLLLAGSAALSNAATISNFDFGPTYTTANDADQGNTTSQTLRLDDAGWGTNGGSSDAAGGNGLAGAGWTITTVDFFHETSASDVVTLTITDGVQTIVSDNSIDQSTLAFGDLMSFTFSGDTETFSASDTLTFTFGGSIRTALSGGGDRGGSLNSLSSGSTNWSGTTDMAMRITAVPEPSSTALLGLGGLALILRRRK